MQLKITSIFDVSIKKALPLAVEYPSLNDESLISILSLLLKDSINKKDPIFPTDSLKWDYDIFSVYTDALMKPPSDYTPLVVI